MTIPFVYKILSSEELNCFAFVSSLNPLYLREFKHAQEHLGDGRYIYIYQGLPDYDYKLLYEVFFFFNLYGIQRKPFSVLLCIYQSFNSRRPMEAVHEHQSWKNLLCHFLLHTW